MSEITELDLIKKDFRLEVLQFAWGLFIKKLPYFLYIFIYICNRLDYKELQKYIFVKKQNSKWDKMLDKAWNILEKCAVLNRYKVVVIDFNPCRIDVYVRFIWLFAMVYWGS